MRLVRDVAHFLKRKRLREVREKVGGGSESICCPLRQQAWTRLKLQGYLAHKKPPPSPRALGMGLLSGPRGRRFLVSEVPLYSRAAVPRGGGARCGALYL